MNLQIKKILFPTDLSRHARHAFNFASSIADRYGASIAILHILEEIPAQTENRIINTVGTEKWAQIREKREKAVRETLVGKKRENIKQVLDTLRHDNVADDSGRPMIIDEIVVKEGTVAEGIVNQAKARAYDLIVMASYARNMIGDVMMHGVTRKVLRRSKTPVLLVPMPEDN
jgi:nucleotide-binding universal stress UspA family protein